MLYQREKANLKNLVQICFNSRGQSIKRYAFYSKRELLQIQPTLLILTKLLHARNIIRPKAFFLFFYLLTRVVPQGPNISNAFYSF